MIGETTGPLVVARGVTRRFGSSDAVVTALDSVDLDITAGEMLMVTGPSGNGKTTLLNCLSALDEIDGGTVVMDGLDLHAIGDAQRTTHRATRMGFVFQSFNLIGVLSARENVEMALLVARDRSSTAVIRAAAEDMLGRVGLSHRLDHRPAELSGGEQQRVALARALVMGPKLVLADEPTGNLDSKTSEQMHDLVFDLNREHGTTFLIVTHSRDLAQLMPRVVTMRDGRVESDERRELTRGAKVPAAEPAPLEPGPSEPAPAESDATSSDAEEPASDESE